MHADFFGPIGNEMYLIVIDSYSKFIEVVPMFNYTTSSDTIKQLRKIFARYGLPLYFVIYNGLVINLPFLCRIMEFNIC